MKRSRIHGGAAGAAAAASAGEGRGGAEPTGAHSSLGLRVHEWGLNPLFWSYVKLLARDVHGLGTLEGVDDSHVLHGKATHRVEVSGVVVHIKPGATKTLGTYVKYTLDDGTGLLPCTQYERNAVGGLLHEGRAERHELGDLLVVQGKLKRFRGAREVVITSARKPADPNEEALHWLRCVELAETVYQPPFRRGEYVDDALVVSSTQARPSRCDCGAAYAEPVGYCRCVAAPLAQDPDFEFRDALLTYLAAKEESLPPKEHLRFQFARDVRDDPSLREVALGIVSATRSADELAGGGRSGGGRTDPGTVRNAKMIELFRAAISSLHKDGALHFSDKTEDVYVLVSRGRVLQPSIEAACREQGLGLTQESEIIRALQGSALFHHVSGARIRACVHRMKKRALEPDIR